MPAALPRPTAVTSFVATAVALVLVAIGLLTLTGPSAAAADGEELACGAPSIDPRQDRDLFVWRSCETNVWQVLAASGPNGANDRTLYSFYEGTITSNAGISNAQEFGGTIDGGDRFAFVNGGIDFRFGLGSGRGGIDSFTFEVADASVVCLDLSRAGRNDRIRVGADAVIVEAFPVNLITPDRDCTPPPEPTATATPPPTPTATPTPIAGFVSECLSRDGGVIRLSGEQTQRYRLSSVEDNTIFDATDARWSGLDADGNAIPWTVTLRDAGTGTNSCWFGGEINGPWDENAPDVSWEDPFHRSGAMTIDIPDFLFEGIRVNNQGDGLRPYGADARMRSVWLTDIHDDCVENDDLYSLTITDSLFDGCYVGFSARTWVENPPDGSDNVWHVDSSLLRLEAQPTVYSGPAPGHGQFFKWDNAGLSPKLSLHNTILRADQLPNHGTLGIPDSLVFDSCSNNTMVWLGDGPFPEPLPDCFTITTDVGVWDDAVAAWRAAHASVFADG